MKKIISAFTATTIMVALLTTMTSCKKDKETSPEPASTTDDPVSEVNPTPTTNSLIVNKVSYARYDETTFSGNYNCYTQFQETGVIAKPSLDIALPNTSPATGDYKLVNYVNSSTYPGKNKVALAVYIGNTYYYSKLDTTILVHVVKDGDSIEVSFENIKLYKKNTTEYKVVSAKYKIATQVPVPVFTGTASFTGGSANKIDYTKLTSYHKFQFSSTSWGNFGSLSLYFTEMPSATKTYSITKDEFPTTNSEVYINILTNSLETITVNETGKNLSLTVNPNGSMTFSFSGVVAEKSDLEGNTTATTMTGSGRFTQQ